MVSGDLVTQWREEVGTDQRGRCRPAQPQDFSGQGNDGVPASATAERSEKSLGLVVLLGFVVVLLGALVYLACCKPPG